MKVDKLELVDKEGRVRATLGFAEETVPSWTGPMLSPALTFYDLEGKSKVFLGLSVLSTFPRLSIESPEDDWSIFLGMSRDHLPVLHMKSSISGETYLSMAPTGPQLHLIHKVAEETFGSFSLETFGGGLQVIVSASYRKAQQKAEIWLHPDGLLIKDDQGRVWSSPIPPRRKQAASKRAKGK